jgi:hypothetical protein
MAEILIPLERVTAFHTWFRHGRTVQNIKAHGKQSLP